MSSLILIDLSAIFWRLWHAMDQNEMNEARRRTIGMVEEIARDHDYCAVAVDHPPYFRSKIFEEYKAGREHSEMAVGELKKTIESIKSIGINCYDAEGYEADDIIATLATQANLECDHDIYVAGSDKDLLQISDIKIFNPFDRKEKTSEEVFGCPTDKVVDILALMGDKADNIPGLKNVGKVKANQILEYIGSVENFLSFSDQEKEQMYLGMKPAMETSLKDGIIPLELSLSLVKLHYDAPVTLKLEKYIEIEKADDPKVKDETEIQETSVEVVERKSEALIKADTRNAQWSLALEPVDLNTAWKTASFLHKSRMFGQFPNPESICAVIMRGRELGIGCTTALSSFHVVKNKPTMSADLILGLILNSGKCEYFDLLESSEEISTFVTKRRGAKHEIKLSYTIGEATNAGLLNKGSGGKESNWTMRPKTMLRKRNVVELGRIVYPDIVTGLYTPEEIEESL